MISINKYYKLLVGMFVCGSMYSYSQTTPTANTPAVPAPTQPLELPNFIIEGKEQLNVQAGIKQFPSRPATLTKSEIDSINPIQKLQALLLPPKSMPIDLLNKSYKKGYLKADLGNYTTANILAGYEFNSDEFTVLGKGFLNYTDGYLKNTDKSGGGIDLSLFYIAPKKYWIFGGSKTTANIAYSNYSYKLFAMDSVADRSASTFKLSVDSEGEYQGFGFNTGASFKAFTLDHFSLEGFENTFNGYIGLKTNIDNVEFSAKSELQLSAISGNSTNLFNIGGGVKFILDDMTFDLNGSFSSVGSTDDVQRANIALLAGFDYRLNQEFTIKANLVTGFDNQQFENIWTYNRFMTNMPDIDFSYKKSISAFLQYHPNQIIMASVGFEKSATDRQKYFVMDSLKVYDLKYADSEGFAVFAKGSAELTSVDKLYAEIKLQNNTATDSSSNKLPFVPSILADIAYDRNWTDKFGTKIEMNYVGKRYSDLNNKNELDAFINLKLCLEYKLNTNFKIYGLLDNLLNSDIYIWDKYKEREIYIAAGILWQF